MLLIVAHHYVVNSGLKQVLYDDLFSPNSIFFFIFGAWGKTSINCFVLITGYFMCTSRISLRKFLKLFTWILFYDIVISSIFILLGYHPLGVLKLLMGLIKFRSVTDNFPDCFVLFYLFIPFLNIIIANMTKKQHQYLLVLLLFVYVFHSIYPIVAVSMNYVSWFCVLYLISSYLRLHPFKHDNDTRLWRTLTFISFGMSVVSIFFMNWISAKIGMDDLTYDFIADSNAILALTNGITSFMWFKNIKIKNSKIINTIAASSFGVLLIHANSDTMRQWLWKDTIDCIGHYDTPLYWLYAIGCVIAIYAVCTIIDIIRAKTIETPLLNITERMCMTVYKKFSNKSNSK